jgi:hypothetical protein
VPAIGPFQVWYGFPKLEEMTTSAPSNGWLLVLEFISVSMAREGEGVKLRWCR